MEDNLTTGAAGAATLRSAAAAVKNLTGAFEGLSDSIREAFKIRGYQDYLQTVKRFGKSLADQLLVLQMSLGRMKVAIAQAFAPLVSVAVPYINRAISAITRFASLAGQVLAGVLAGVTGNDALAKSAEKAADAEDSLKVAATGAGKAARRSLMGFDEINRLSAPTGGGGSAGTTVTPGGITISPEAQVIIDKILAALERLKTLLAPLKEALQKLFTVVGGHLRWLWDTVLVPFAGWIAETLAPALADFFAGGIGTVTAALEPLLTGLQSLWTALQPIAAFIGETLVQRLRDWQAAFGTLTDSFRENGGSVVAVFENIGQIISAVWSWIAPIFRSIRQLVSEVFSAVARAAGDGIGYITGALSGLTGFLAGIFTGDWKKTWQGLVDFLKGAVNSIIGFFNSMASGITAAVNGIIRGANRISFTVPDWVPGVGGRHFGLNMKTLQAPQIPYLARGAVLPANRPFLAVVGDQRRGTNIEAPLDTIRQAVALELGTLAAGLEAMVTEQRRTRQAVSDIRVGDTTIGRAALRYQDKLLTLTGGL